jgi:hypothetical protein
MALPVDPFKHSTPGEQMVEDGRLLLEQMLSMQTPDEVANAVFALEEDDLRALAIVLVAHLHPAIAVTLCEVVGSEGGGHLDFLDRSTRAREAGESS